MSTFDSQVNPRKLFVGNLPYSATEDQLSEVFGQYGEIKELRVITDRMTGRSKGIAFVEFVEESAAQAAIEGANGMELDGRAMIVNVARPFQPRERSNNGGGFHGGNDRRGGGGYGGGNRGGYGRRD